VNSTEIFDHGTQLVGKIIEIFGVFLTATTALQIREKQRFLAFGSALVRGKRAEKAARLAIAFPAERDVLTVLKVFQGLALVILGLMIQASFHLIELLHSNFFRYCCVSLSGTSLSIQNAFLAWAILAILIVTDCYRTGR
jgi:hypothetical protein